MTDLEYANSRVDALKEAVANAQRRFERDDDHRSILVDLFVETGFAERRDFVATPPPARLGIKPPA